MKSRKRPRRMWATTLPTIAACLLALYLGGRSTVAASGSVKADAISSGPCGPMKRPILSPRELLSRLRAGRVQSIDVMDSIKLQRTTLPSEMTALVDVRFFGDVKLTHDSFAGDLSFTNVEFCKSDSTVDFSGNAIGGNFVLNAVYFASAPAFDSMRVVGRMAIYDAAFSAGATFSGVKTGENFRICNGRFDDDADFEQMNVGGNIEIGKSDAKPPCQGPVFGGLIDFTRAKIGSNFRICGALVTKIADFEQMDVGKHFELGRSRASSSCAGPTFWGAVDFRGSKVGRNFDVGEATFKGMPTSFADLSVGNLASFGSPPKKIRFSLAGMTYRDIEVLDGESRKRHDSRREAVLRFVEQSEYAGVTYAALTAHYSQADDPVFADTVFVRGRQMERMTILKCDWNPFAWPICIARAANLVFLDWAVGYGRHTARVILVGTVLVLAGWVLFRHENFMKKTSPNAPSYHGLVYSLDLFAPVIDLGMAKRWAPRRYRWVTYVYKFIGWLLVPIAVAYVSGLVK